MEPLIAYFHFAAEAQELATQASLTAVVFSCTRRKISIGERQPFDTLFSSLQLTQSASATSDLSSSAVLSDLVYAEKLKMSNIIILGVSLKAISGRSIAMMLIPNLGYWTPLVML